jgi:hypothetical protein
VRPVTESDGRLKPFGDYLVGFGRGGEIALTGACVASGSRPLGHNRFILPMYQLQMLFLYGHIFVIYFSSSETRDTPPLERCQKLVQTRKQNTSMK